jgi:hypothetical protein
LQAPVFVFYPSTHHPAGSTNLYFPYPAATPALKIPLLPQEQRLHFLKLSSTLIVLATLLAGPLAPATAKSLNRPPHATALLSAPTGDQTTTELRRLEQRMSSFLLWRNNQGPHPGTHGLYAPAQSDFMAIARYSQQLSPEFMASYRMAIEAPSNFMSHTSPGGHFQIFFAPARFDSLGRTLIDTLNAVDSTDTIGFSPTNWRLRTRGPNGIPDYIDEVAWACDSSWSMQAQRFGFATYLPYDTTRLYPVQVRHQGGLWDYGATHYDSAISPQGGYYSTIELRNSWNEWGNHPYKKDPRLGIRVTIAHEFFHAIQYAMARTIKVKQIYGTFALSLDNLPIAWLEATAVLMEELAFDSINDYRQYVPDYFAMPQLPLLRDEVAEFYSNGSDWRSIYLNGLMGLFLYQRSATAPSIDFVKSVFVNSSTGLDSFALNLNQRSIQIGAASWGELLNRFHSESFFTGSRARPPYFISEAPQLPQWRYDPITHARPLISQKSLRRWGMQHFALSPGKKPTQNLTIQILGYDSSLISPPWSGSLIVRRSLGDTIIPLNFSPRGNDTISVANWQSCQEVVVVLTSISPNQSVKATVAFDTLLSESQPYSPPTADTLAEPPTIAISPNPVSLSDNGNQRAPVNFSLEGISTISVYTLNGTLVWQHRTPHQTLQSAPTPSWNLRNRAGELVSPGSYYALISYSSPSNTHDLTLLRRKILIIP